MFKRTRPIFALTVAPLLLAMFNGCSGPSVEAAPLNVAAISGIKSYHVRINMTQSIPDANGHWITSKSTIDEDCVGRDRLRRTVLETENGKTTRSQVIVIGVNEWYKEDGEWMLFPVRVPAAGLNGMFVSTLLTSMDQLARFANLPTKGERLNGQRAVHYFARDGETGRMAAGWDLWMAGAPAGRLWLQKTFGPLVMAPTHCG